MQTYLFYDIETTGLSKSFDQVLHFAAIRTDLHLKELDRHEIKIKLNPDVIPSPYALITHKMGIHEIVNGVLEFDAIKQIHHWLNTPGTISLGYNTLGFDDEFLRFSFYRNLLKPYTHQYANQCYRMDIYPIAILFYLFKKEIITWPLHDHKISFKLENLNAANQFVSGRSHHAMVDVEVTLQLARRFLEEREIWEYVQGYFKKETDKTRIEHAEKNIAFCISGKLGSEAHYQCPVLFLGNHRHYSNQTIWLRLDLEGLDQVTPETILENTWGINKKFGEPPFILPYKDRFIQSITRERIQLAEKNKQWLHDNPTLFDAITTYYLNYKYPLFPETDVDARLYMNGFWSAEEEFFCRRFHTNDSKAKANLLEQTSNATLKTLALRILGRQNPELLSHDHREVFAKYMQRIYTHDTNEALIDYQGKKRLTPDAAIQDIAKIRAENTLDKTDLQLLLDFEAYLHSRGETFMISS